MSNIALLAIGLVVSIVGVWTVARVMRAIRLGRHGFGVGAEDRRLRDDPRFTDAWVKQFRPGPPADRQEPPPAG